MKTLKNHSESHRYKILPIKNHNNYPKIQDKKMYHLLNNNKLKIQSAIKLIWK